jgi:hypothetical protein
MRDTIKPIETEMTSSFVDTVQIKNQSRNNVGNQKQSLACTSIE